MAVLPEIDAVNEAYWTGGGEGKVMLSHCPDCERFIHPPERICPYCLGRDVAPRAVPGEATVYSFTINHQPWLPDMEVPFAIVVADIDAAPGVRITARLATDDLDGVAIGQKLAMDFEQVEDVRLPFFRRIEDVAR